MTLLAHKGSSAATGQDVHEVAKAMAVQCMAQEEAKRGLPRGILLAIAKVESGLKWRAINRNRDGSYDIGIMQINSRHLPRLRQWGIDEQKIWHPCINVSVGAFILHEFMAQHGVNWAAVAAYNTGDPYRKPDIAKSYAYKVYKQYISTFRMPSAAP